MWYKSKTAEKLMSLGKSPAEVVGIVEARIEKEKEEDKKAWDALVAKEKEYTEKFLGKTVTILGIGMIVMHVQIQPPWGPIAVQFNYASYGEGGDLVIKSWVAPVEVLDHT